MLNDHIFSSMGWNVDSQKRKKVYLCSDFVNLQTQNFIKRLVRSLLENLRRIFVLSKFGFLLKLIWCMSRQSCLRPFDGNCRSSTAVVLDSFTTNRKKMFSYPPLEAIAKSTHFICHCLLHLFFQSLHSSIFTSSFPSVKDSIDSLKLGANHSIEELVVSILASESKCSEKPDKSFTKFDSRWHSNWYFPVTTGLLSSVWISNYNLSIVAEVSKTFFTLTFASKSW